MRERVEQGVGAGASKAGDSRRPGSARRVTLALIVMLLAMGALGAGSLWALNGAQTSAPTSSEDQLAARVCTAYQTRNYDLLIATIDPTPVPPTAPTAFDDNAKKSFTGELQALDSQSGAVTRCTFQQIAPVSAAHVHYGFTMTRAKGRQSTQIMDFVREKDGTWKIARDSQFTPVG